MCVCSVIPTLEAGETAEKVYRAISERRKEVYIQWYIEYMRIVVEVMPLRVRDYMI